MLTAKPSRESGTKTKSKELASTTTKMGRSTTDSESTTCKMAFVILGDGKEEWPDGSSYNGQYKEGKKNGKGIFVWFDGSKFEGDFVNNKIEGYGVYEWPDNRKYSGF